MTERYPENAASEERVRQRLEAAAERVPLVLPEDAIKMVFWRLIASTTCILEGFTWCFELSKSSWFDVMMWYLIIYGSCMFRHSMGKRHLNTSYSLTCGNLQNGYVLILPYLIQEAFCSDSNNGSTVQSIPLSARMIPLIMTDSAPSTSRISGYPFFQHQPLPCQQFLLPLCFQIEISMDQNLNDRLSNWPTFQDHPFWFRSWA